VQKRRVLKKNALLRRLDFWYEKTNTPEFIPRDPVQFPRRFSVQEDIEIAAFLASVIAWGRRDLILKSAERMFGLLGKSPYAFVIESSCEALKTGGRRCIHRTFFEDDLRYFCRGFKRCYEKYGTLEGLFRSAMGSPPDIYGGIWKGISLYRETMTEGNNGRYSKHIANPEANSACKRINLALRWLVRTEGPVDMGLWKTISPASLFIPLDLHVGRAARSLGLLDPGRKANDRKAVMALTGTLREFCPEDPVRYDLALFGIGV
jgi:uncharacterized protein (TIGR02757 family)